jgi:hypothetical protein
MRLSIFVLVVYLFSTAIRAKFRNMKKQDGGDCDQYHPCKGGLICYNDQCVISIQDAHSN